MIRRVFQHFWVKVISLLLAAIIWLVISAQRREPSIERAFEVPLALVGVPQELIITTPIPDSIDVRVRGTLSRLRSISSQNLEATINLSGVRPSELTVAIRPQSLSVPEDIEIVSISPAKVNFRLEQRRQKIVPIRPYLVGQLPSGYVLGTVDVNPPNALVSGPVSRVRDFSEVATDRIILSGRTASFLASVPLVSDSPLVRVIEPASAQISVEVKVEDSPDNGGDSTTTDASARITAPASNN